MADANDMDLLREFARHNSETAFAELVRRHINLVYSVALRFAGGTDDAQDVTQAVFIILARKAARLNERTVLTGWLYETTRFTAIRLLRTRARRQAHEQEAYMQSTLEQAGTDNLWRQLAPHLEAAMSRLNARERTLLALRFYENKTGAEAAALLGIREEAAHKRTARALEKLRKFFTKRGVSSTTAMLAGAISANSVQAAPVDLAKAVTAVAVAKGVTASISTLTLIKGALKIMAWTKMKTAVVVGVGILLAVATTTVTVREIRAHHHYSWQVPKASRDMIRQTSPQVAIVPSVFAHDGGTYRDYTTGGGAMGIYQTISNIVNVAYDGQQYHLIFPTGIPDGRYDFFAKAVDPAQPFFQKDLQAELKNKLGIVGKLEMRNSDVLLLRYQNPNAGGLKPPDSLRRGLGLPKTMRSRSETNALYSINDSLSMLHGFLQTTFVKPVIDQTGLTNNYDFILKWDDAVPNHPNKEGIRQALLDQLGLELVPTNMPIEMLVVEKTQ